MADVPNASAGSGESKLGHTGILLLGLYFLLLPLLLIFLAVLLWPPPKSVVGSGVTGPAAATQQAAAQQQATGPATRPAANPVWLDEDVRLMLLVLVFGALGSYIHAASSFVAYVGNGNLVRSWVWWYVLRTSIGMVLALAIYLVVRGGFFSPAPAAEGAVNPYGIAALALLTGMFSKQATDKLQEVFTTLFRTQEAPRLKDKLGSTLPSVAGLDPDRAESGAAAPGPVKVTGGNFRNGSTVVVDGTDRRTTFVGPNELRFELDPKDLATAGTRKVTVRNPPPEGGASEPRHFTVAPPPQVPPSPPPPPPGNPPVTPP